MAATNTDAEASTQAMYGMLTNIAFILITNQLIKYFNLTDPAYLLYVRIGFAATQALILMFLFVLRMRIERVGPKDGTVEVVEPAMVPGNPPTKSKMTPREYDLMMLSSQVKGVISGFLFSAALHYFFKSSHLLIMGAVNSLRAIASLQLVKLYVYGQPSEGLLKRPFQDPPSPIAELFKQLTQPDAPRAASALVKKAAGSDDSSDEDEPIKVFESEPESEKSEVSKSSNKSNTNKNSVRQRKN